jgi:hypothetical protein
MLSNSGSVLAASHLCWQLPTSSEEKPSEGESAEQVITNGGYEAFESAAGRFLNI